MTPRHFVTSRLVGLETSNLKLPTPSDFNQVLPCLELRHSRRIQVDCVAFTLSSFHHCRTPLQSTFAVAEWRVQVLNLAREHTGIDPRTKTKSLTTSLVSTPNELHELTGLLQAYKEVKDAVLFAIDISHNMLASPIAGSKKGNQDCAALAALKCAYQLMQQRIISNPTDMMGVLLFGTEETKFMDGAEANASSYPHCYLLTDLRVPAATDVKHLRNLVQDENECARIMKPSKDGVAMSNVLFCANQIFTMKAANFSSRRLFLVTDNDSPHADDKIARNAAAVRAKDLYDLGVLIELFPISHPHHDFDRTLFYDVSSSKLFLAGSDMPPGSRLSRSPL